MNGPQSDGNENTMDIFVLSTSTTDSSLQARDLEKLGYRTTFFSNARELFESLRSGKPNLLICDSVPFQEEAYDLCRAIKADYDLWVVPVLILTSASSLSDLLHVLDCNADNFISVPFDPSYLSALIEGMLSTPVERQTPEQVKTQFKIQHDDHLFVVTADRRKLLEFLLSSFEIAVNKSGEIIRITGEKTNLSATIQQREERIRDQARSIEALNATLRQKEQSISALSAEGREKDQQIREKTDEVRQLREEIGQGKTHIAAAEEQVERLTREAGDLAHRYSTETGDLSQKLSTISEQLERTSADLTAAEESLARETSKKTVAETRIIETTARIEQAEASIRELTREREQRETDLATEREHVRSLETAIQDLKQAKSESEQNLFGTISRLEEAMRQRDDDLVNLKAKLSSTSAALEEREHDAAFLKTELEQITQSRDSTVSELGAVSQELNNQKEILAREQENRRSIEERLAGEVNDLETALVALRDEHQTARNRCDEYENTLNRVQSDLQAALAKQTATEEKLATATAQIQSLDSELGQATSDGKENLQKVENLTRELEQVTAERDEIQKSHTSAEITLSEERHEREKIARELEEAVAARSNLETDLAGVQERVRELESGLAAAATAGADTGKQVHALTDELEHLKAELENSRKFRHNIEESLTGERLEKEEAKRDRERISQERESLASELTHEKQFRAEAETERERLLHRLNSLQSEGATQETALSETIQELTAELESSRARQAQLEVQVAELSREKQRAEAIATSLSDEIDQARSALADEWEDHMNDQERLVAAARDKEHGERPVQPAGELESEKARKRSLIVKGPDLPVSMGKRIQSLSAIQVPEPLDPAVPRITNVEDLFEDEDNQNHDARDELPSVSIIQESSTDDEYQHSPFSDDTGVGSETEEAYADDQEPREDTGGDEIDDEGSFTDTPQSSSDSPDATSLPGISFNKAQWFDLLKWAHHSGTLTQEQRMQIVKMGRLIQKGRKLTHKQEEQVKEMILLVQELGYRFY